MVTDGAGRRAQGRLTGPGAVETDDVRIEPPMKPYVTIYQAATKAGHNDEILERLGELGVGRFRVFESERALAKWSPDRAARVGRRWGSIARTAGKQSRHSHFVDTALPLSWDGVKEQVDADEHVLLLWEGATVRLRDALPADPEAISLIVGPEGGFSEGEADELGRCGASPVSLGRGIIRAENAAFLAASLCLYAYGAIG